MTQQKIPIMESPISAGFPSPALDHIENTLDICDFLIQRPNSTFILKVKWDSMNGKNIQNGDFLVVDKWLDPKIWNIVIAELWWEFTCKELQKDKNWKLYLQAYNKDFKALYPDEDTWLIIWGVVVGRFNKI